MKTMENGNFCLIWNYESLAVKKFFKATLVKKFVKIHKNIGYLYFRNTPSLDGH